MTKRNFPSDVLAQAQQAVVRWDEIDPSLTFGPVNLISLMDDIKAAGPLQADIERHEVQLGEKRDERDILYNRIWDMVRRFRNGVKVIYGSDSMEYETVGGVRTSDRKSPVRRTSASE